MAFPKIIPARDANILRKRVNYFFNGNRGLLAAQKSNGRFQLNFPGLTTNKDTSAQDPQKGNINLFLNHLSDILSDGNVYLFGGILRDLAIFGKAGYESDIDIVVDGTWRNIASLLHQYDAKRNKFGGFRIIIDDIPIDIWHAESTWAITNGHVPYRDISSLTNTTILSWDAILMNWKSKQFVFIKNYFDHIHSRTLDIVLLQNPYPLGMLVRILRHLTTKDAKKITMRTLNYLMKMTNIYSYEQIKMIELRSYRNVLIERNHHTFFSSLKNLPGNELRELYDSFNCHQQQSICNKIYGQLSMF
jgi:hypothetical protein